MMTLQRNKTFAIGGSVFVLCSGLMFSGCSMFNTDSRSVHSRTAKWWSWKKEYQVPQSMVAIWSEDILVTPGKPPTRGFGGRLYFYNDRSQAIPVDGELAVYGFDDTAKHDINGVRTEADKRFRFTAEQFKTHFSESELGASYSVWIPWDVAGGPQREIMLLPTFVLANGRVVRGESSKVVLSGIRASETGSGATFQNGGPMMPILGHNQAIRPSYPDMDRGVVPNNQVVVAEATIPTNAMGYLPGGANNNNYNAVSSASFEQPSFESLAPPPMKTTTIQIPQRSSMYSSGR